MAEKILTQENFLKHLEGMIGMLRRKKIPAEENGKTENAERETTGEEERKEEAGNKVQEA